VVSERIESSAYHADVEGGQRTERMVVLQRGWTEEENLEQ
jgi:hypothetical protein